MKYFYTSILFISLFFFHSCTNDSGEVIVTYQEASAIYGDIDQIRNTPLNAPVREIINPGKIYVADDFILIGEEEKGIHVIDNADSKNPITINFIDIPFNREFFVNNNHLYAETQYDMIKVNISDLRNVTLSARIERVFQEELKNDQGETLLGFTFQEKTETISQEDEMFELLRNNNQIYFDFAKNIIPQSAVPTSFSGNSSESSGTVNRISYANDHVFVLGRDKVYAINESSFDGLISVTSFPNSELETIFPYEDKLFVGSRSSMEIIDVSDTNNPEVLYSFDHATSCDPVLPSEDVAYITLRTGEFAACPGNINALVVLNIENLNRPVVAEEINMISPYGMSKVGNLLFVAEGENGLKIFEASNPLELELLEFNQEMIAYDILPHPTDASLILVAGENELGQYLLDTNMSLILESTISY